MQRETVAGSRWRDTTHRTNLQTRSGRGGKAALNLDVGPGGGKWSVQSVEEELVVELDDEDADDSLVLASFLLSVDDELSCLVSLRSASWVDPNEPADRLSVL